MFHHLGIDISANLSLVKLDNVHHLVIGKVGPEFRYRLTCQFEEKLSLVVIINLRVVDQLVYNDVFRSIQYDSAFSNNNINPILLFSEFLDQDIF